MLKFPPLLPLLLRRLCCRFRITITLRTPAGPSCRHLVVRTRRIRPSLALIARLSESPLRPRVASDRIKVFGELGFFLPCLLLDF